MTTIFHNMMGKEVKEYIDDLVVKFVIQDMHLQDLEKVFI